MLVPSALITVGEAVISVLAVLALPGTKEIVSVSVSDDPSIVAEIFPIPDTVDVMVAV